MAIIDRTAAEAIIREQVVSEIFQNAPQQSTFMSQARKLPNMTSNQTRIRVLDIMPVAYWVDGDTGFKQTSEQAWDNVYIEAGELAVIVPIPEAVLADAEIDIFGEVTPRINEAIGKAVDEAVLFGVNKPRNWGLSIFDRARQAGNNVSDSADLYGALLGSGGVFDKVERWGFDVTGILSARGMRAKLRSLRDENGNPIYSTPIQGGTTYAIDGAPVTFPANGAFDVSMAQLLAGDFKQAVYAIRQDITVKILDQGVIQDPSTKAIVYNLAQQDMVALRVVFRMGWALPNPVSALDPDRIGCPFAYLEPATAATTKTVTFTVQDSNSTAIQGARIDIQGAKLKTNASGQAVYNLGAGTYDYTVKANGYTSAAGTVTVSSSAVTQTVTLTANS